MTDPPAVLLAGFDVWPGPSAWARRMTESVRASANRHRVLTLSLRGPSLAHTESLFGARVLRVPPGPGPLLEQLEVFGRAVQRQLDSDTHALVHTADPLVGAAVLAHPRRPALLYEARRLPSTELPLLLGRGRDGAVLDQALRLRERQCLDRADAVLVSTRSRAEEVRAGGRRAPVHLVPDAVEAGPQLPRVPGPLRIRHVGWDLSTAGLHVLLEALHVLGPGARLHLVQPRSKPWDPALQREVSAAARSGAVTSGPPGALPGSWADVEVLSGLGPDCRAPAVLADALEAYARGRPVLAADSEVARADLPAGCTVFFPGGDGRALGEALAALASTSGLLAASGVEARAYVERRHDGARVRGLLRDLYRAHGAVPAVWQLGSGASRPSMPPGWSGSPRPPGDRAPEGTDPGTPSGGFG
ncbi:MAG TPA: glycosyltransferase [Myxococcaceae bacterium]|nr:glycosyltransferase [Myxococcaceae bacterium]